MEKNYYREKYRLIRKNINKEKDIVICQELANSFMYKQAQTILLYYPLKDEINTIPIIKEAIKKKKKIALPKCQGNTISFYYLNDLNDLHKGMFNIMEPNSSSKLTNFCNSICIVPGIAFDKNYNRLGYGKGYYDCFLKDYPGLKIGLCYEELLVEKIPTDIYDIPVDMIITEKKMYYRK